MNKRAWIVVIVWMCVVLANAQPYQWGSATNGICLGTRISSTNGITQPPFLCTIYLTNVTSKQILVHVPPIKQRYEITLINPLGQLTNLSSDKLMFYAISGNRPISLWASNIADTSSFFIMDNFNIKTNGLYTLIVSSRVATNYTAPKPKVPLGLADQPSIQPIYFDLPLVTNTFTVLPGRLEK
jgi:hypothetical protein